MWSFVSAAVTKRLLASEDRALVVLRVRENSPLRLLTDAADLAERHRVRLLDIVFFRKAWRGRKRESGMDTEDEGDISRNIC